MTEIDPLSRAREAMARSPQTALEFAEAATRNAVGRDLALAQQMRTRALRALGRHAEALAVFDAARSAAEQAGEELLAAQVRIGAVDTLGMLGRYDEAEALAEALAGSLRAGGATTDAAQVLGNLGSLHLRRDRYQEALAAYAGAGALLSEADEPLIRAALAVNRAIALTYLERDAEALADYRRAQSLYEAQGLSFEAAVVRTNIGFLHGGVGRVAVALAELTAAYPVFAAAGRDHEAARCDLDTGDAYRALNLLPEARTCYERALSVFDRLPLHDDRARAEIGLAALAIEQRRFADARALLDRAEAYLAGPGNAVLLAQVRLHRANAWLRQGRGGRARDEALAARQALADAGLRGWAAEAGLLAALADEETSPAVFAGIAEIARETSRAWLECRAERALGGLLRRRGERAEGVEHLRRAVEVLESARAQIAPEDLHLAFLSDREDVYADLTALLLEGSPSPADLAEALAVIERSRSRLLLERLLSAQTGPGGEGAGPVRERVAELRARLSRAYRDALSPEAEETRRPGAGMPERDLVPLEAAYARALREAELGGGFPETTLRGTLPDLDTLGQALAPEETLLLYARTGERLSAFLLRRDGLRVLPDLASSADAGHVARRFRYHLRKMAMAPDLRASIADGLRAEMDAVLERLHGLLLAPVLPHLTGTRLIIVPCEPLQGVPFHALKDGTGYLLDRFEIVTAPSASVWHTLASRSETRPPGSGGALLVGVPGAGTEHVPAELAAIARRIPARVLCGGEATVGNVRRAAPSASLLHLATHALFRRDNPLFSGLQLADDWLLGRDLYGMRLRADLVTLSACDTGASRIEPGEEWMGLARGFLSAGAARVLVSLWPADDAATAQQMAAFYGHLRDGLGPAGALRRAQREMRARHPHPYYWAAFCLIGSH